MYYYPFHYPAVHPMPSYPGYPAAYPIPRTYPPVDTKIFAGSVKSFRLLMEQGSILLDRLGDLNFSKKLMSEAQQGKNAEVDQMIKSIGLKVPVITKFTPSGVNFILTTEPTQQHPSNCCTLTVAMKWGQ
ncbi:MULTISPECIES: hypothetical protein [Bacillaceae]|uniref:hypothetical protein n=1 Tax=Bacillaceae TaxID=186817 RepID=UPI0011899272|nr:hypothetical protein [Bacillus sp. S3]QCJ41374.1 hypothetical protein FAY30_05395 [Bacillus sp. S3]